MTDTLVARNTEKIIGQQEKTNQKLDAILTELKALNGVLSALAAQRAPA